MDITFKIKEPEDLQIADAVLQVLAATEEPIVLENAKFVIMTTDVNEKKLCAEVATALGLASDGVIISFAISNDNEDIKIVISNNVGSGLVCQLVESLLVIIKNHLEKDRPSLLDFLKSEQRGD